LINEVDGQKVLFRLLSRTLLLMSNVLAKRWLSRYRALFSETVGVMSFMSNRAADDVVDRGVVHLDGQMDGCL
jgi:hypothetical protein